MDSKLSTIKAQMCSTLSCFKCPLSKFNNFKSVSCLEFITEYPDEAPMLIKKWDKSHPAKPIEKLPM